MDLLHKLSLFLVLPSVLALGSGLLGAALVWVLGKLGAKGVKAEHSVESALDHALAVLAEVKAVAPNPVADEVSVAVSALDRYLKAHDLGDVTAELQAQVKERLAHAAQ